MSVRDLARRMLEAYSAYAGLEATLPETGQIISIEHSNRFRLLADVPPIESRIDLLELQGKDLVVSDLKTSKSRWSDAKVQEAIPQLVLYATGQLPLMRELGANRIVTKFVVVTKAKKPIVQILQADSSSRRCCSVEGKRRSNVARNPGRRVCAPGSPGRAIPANIAANASGDSNHPISILKDDFIPADAARRLHRSLSFPCGNRRRTLMSVKLLNSIPARRRDRMFAKIRRLINEVDAVDRSLEHCGEAGFAVDETLEAVVGMFRGEMRRVKKSRGAVAA